MESLTLSDSKVSTMLTKFGIMCQILPFYGHVNLWKYTLEKLSPQTKAFWNEYIYPILKNKTNSNVLNLTKYMKFQIIENTKPINEEFINYIKSPDIGLLYKFRIRLNITLNYSLTKQELEREYSLFEEFLKFCNKEGMQILFEDILVNQYHTTSKDLIKIYTQLYQQGLGQEKILLRFTQFTLIYSYYTQALDYVDLVNQDTSLPEGKTVNEIIDSGDTELLEQGVGFCKQLTTNQPNRIYGVWSPLLFDVSSLTIHYFNTPDMTLENLDQASMMRLSETVNELKILSSFDPSFTIEKFNDLKGCFPNLTQIHFSPYLYNHNLYEFLPTEAGAYTMTIISQTNIENYTSYMIKSKLCGDKKPTAGNEIPNIVFGIINLGSGRLTFHEAEYIAMGSPIYQDSIAFQMVHDCRIGNIRSLSQNSTAESLLLKYDFNSLSDEMSPSIPGFSQNYDYLIVDYQNIEKIVFNNTQKYFEPLTKADKYVVNFFITEWEELKNEDLLISHICEFLKINEQSKAVTEHFPATQKVPELTVKYLGNEVRKSDLRFFWMLKNKNIVDFISLFSINLNADHKRTKAEKSYFEIIKNLPCLKIISLNISEKSQPTKFIKFRNLSKSRLELIIDNVLNQRDCEILTTLMDKIEISEEDPYFKIISGA